MSLSIHLLPEFGWSIGGRQIIGPGSVFQGRVELGLHQALAMDRLRLVFCAQECLKSYDIAPGVIRSKTSSLFSHQQILWDSKGGHGSRDVGHYHHTFTIQMPMTLYPPSVDNKLYNCTFKLIAIVEFQRQQQYEIVMSEDLVILYMPFVETSLLKRPLITTRYESGLHVAAKLHSLKYVPGDSILCMVTIDTKSTNVIKNQLHITLSLHRTVANLLFTDVPDSNQLVAASTIKLSPACDNRDNQGSNTTYSSSLEIYLPHDLTPTFTYSHLSSTTYRLRLVIKRKGHLSMWSQGLKMEWPLTIGTLGAGVHSSSELIIYNALDNVVDSEQYTPKFMKEVVHEHALPVYEPSQLPDYQAYFCDDNSSGLV